MPHAVARLRHERLSRSQKPFLARGSRVERCPKCRLPHTYCICEWQPHQMTAYPAVCLIMHDTEPLKPSNTGWLIADVLADTWAFGWQRTHTDPALSRLLQDPSWQPFVVFPAEYARPEQEIVQRVECTATRRPLLIFIDATWTEARKVFRKSPYLAKLPVLSIQPETLSRYRLRRSNRPEHLCTAEVAAMCLELAQAPEAAQTLNAWFDVFTQHYLAAKQHQRPQTETNAHHYLKYLKNNR